MKKVIVTGANAGIGFETARQLGEKGMQVILLGRREEALREAASKIKNVVGYYVVDLSLMESVRKVAVQIVSEHEQIDVLVNNAGGVFSRYEETVEGIEKQWASNFLGPYLLTGLLLPSLQRSGFARIVNVSSDSHYAGKVEINNPGLKGEYSTMKAYAQSKLCNVLFTYAVHKRLSDKGIRVYALHPGLVKTDIGKKAGGWLESLGWQLWSMGGIRVEDGAATSVYLASSSEVESKSGTYWDKCKEKKSSGLSYDIELQEKVMQIAAQTTGFYFDKL